MKKFSFSLAYLLSVLCFCCVEDDKKLQLKPDLSKLKISEKSTGLIDRKKNEIQLVLNNASANDVELKAPEFDFPEEVIQIQPNEVIKDNKVSIAAHQEKTLTYKFIVNPTAKAQNGKIKVSFADKDYHIGLTPLEDQLKMVTDESTQELSLLRGGEINNKEINLVINNSNGQPIEIDEPSFKVPEGMYVNLN